jgi:hypothetical protein
MTPTAPSPFRERSSSSNRPRQRQEESSSSRPRTHAATTTTERSSSTSRGSIRDGSKSYHVSPLRQKPTSHPSHSNSEPSSRSARPAARPTVEQSPLMHPFITTTTTRRGDTNERRSSSRTQPTSRLRREESLSTNPSHTKHSSVSSNTSIGSNTSNSLRSGRDPPASSSYSSTSSMARTISQQRSVGESPSRGLVHQESLPSPRSSSNSRPQQQVSGQGSHASTSYTHGTITTSHTQQAPITAGNNPLSWRSDPDSSFSDWIIEIVTRDLATKTKVKTLYHCHSNVLAWGPRRCEAFVTLFQQRLTEIPSNNVSTIELNPLEASSFPYLLDFLYCETQIPLSASKACALCLLADRLKINSLQKAIETYVERALNLDQMIEFITCARQYNAGDKLVFFANSKLCGYLVKNPKEGGKVPPDVLAHVLHKRQQCVKVLKGEDPRRYSGDWEAQRSQLLSRVVGECVMQQNDEWQKQCAKAKRQQQGKNSSTTAVVKAPPSPITRELFDRLTNKMYLPHIDTNAAIQLLKVDGLLGNHPSRNVDHPEVPGQANMTCLQERCTQSIIQSWRILMRQCSQAASGGGGHDENHQDVGNRMHPDDEGGEEHPEFSLLSLSTLSESLRQVAPHVLADMLVLTALQYETILAQERKLSHRPRDFYGGSKLGLYNPNGKPLDDIVIDNETGPTIHRPISPLFMCGQGDDDSFHSKKSQGPPKPEDSFPRRFPSRHDSSSLLKKSGGGAPPLRRPSTGTAPTLRDTFDESSIGFNSVKEQPTPQQQQQNQREGTINLFDRASTALYSNSDRSDGIRVSEPSW